MDPNGFLIGVTFDETTALMQAGKLHRFKSCIYKMPYCLNTSPVFFSFRSHLPALLIIVLITALILTKWYKRVAIWMVEAAHESAHAYRQVSCHLI
jgi:hypothetical protein